MTAFFAHHFTKVENESLEGLKILPEPVYGDEKDFTGIWNLQQHSNGDDREAEDEDDGVK